MYGQVDLRHRRGGSGDHPRKETVAIEPPPVPLQHVGRDKGRHQRRDDPLGHGMDVLVINPNAIPRQITALDVIQATTT